MLLIPVVLAATIVGSLLAPFWLIPAKFAVISFASCLPLALFVRSRYRLFLIVCGLLFFVLANVRYPLQFPVDERLEQLCLSKRKILVTAELEQVTQRAAGRSQLDLRLIRLGAERKDRSISATGRVRLYVDEPVSGLLPGDRLQFTTRLRKPRLFGVPGEFHWPRYLASQNIAATGWVKSSTDLTVTGRGKDSLLRTIAAGRESAAGRISELVSERQSVLLRALLLGESRVLPDKIRGTLADAGISHLFAISGLHLGLIGLFVYRLGFCLYRRCLWLIAWQPPQRLLPLLILPFLLAYLLLTGDAIATRRAFCVAIFAAGFWLWGYSVNPFRLLMLLALLFLLANPLLLWQPGWQLSFAGAAGILLWLPLCKQLTARFRPLFRAPLQMLLVTTAATLATLPLVLSNFHLLAPIGLLANLVAVPLIALLALPVGIIGLLVSSLPLLGKACFAMAGTILELTLRLMENLLAWPGLSAHSLFLSRWEYLAIGLLVLPLIVLGYFENRRQLIRFSAICILLALLCKLPVFTRSEAVTLHMFSVGQGESMLLSAGSGRAVLIDGGGLYSDRFDVGERLLAPALGEIGVHSLQAVLLTHDHPDHSKGLVYILRNFPVAEFWANGKLDQLAPRLQQVLEEKAIPVQTFPAGWTTASLWPSSSDLRLYRDAFASNKNDSSLVLYLGLGEGGLLLTGDLEKRGVRRLLRAGLPGPVSLLKLPHHGSRHSATDRLVRTLLPELCLVSAGYQNRYGFPAKPVVDDLHQLDIPLYRTDLLGTLRVRQAAGHWQVEHWQDGLFR